METVLAASRALQKGGGGEGPRAGPPPSQLPKGTRVEAASLWSEREGLRVAPGLLMRVRGSPWGDWVLWPRAGAPSLCLICRENPCPQVVSSPLLGVFKESVPACAREPSVGEVGGSWGCPSPWQGFCGAEPGHTVGLHVRLLGLQLLISLKFSPRFLATRTGNVICSPRDGVPPQGLLMPTVRPHAPPCAV